MRWCRRRLRFCAGKAKHRDHLETLFLLDLAKTVEGRGLVEIHFSPQLFAWPFAAPRRIPADRAAALRDAFNKTVLDVDFVAAAERLVLEPELVDVAMLENVLRRIYAAPKPLLDQARRALPAGQ